MSSLLNFKIFKITFLLLILAEILSFFGWMLPEFNSVVFFVILAVTLILSLHKLEYGLLILLAELFIGSKGYLFSFEGVSIRIGLFIIIMAVFLMNVILRERKFNKLSPSLTWRQLVKFSLVEGSRKLLQTFGLLSVVIIWAFIWGLIRGNGFDNVFLDFNNWLFLLLVFPVFDLVRKDNDFIKNILSILSAAVVWLGIKSLILLYIFTHESTWALPEIYKWIRDTRVGEITEAGFGFWRIFMQSQIYSLLLFFIILPFIFTKTQKQENTKTFSNYQLPIINYLFLVISLTTVILSFSRSYWVGLAVGLLFYFFITLLFNKNILDLIRKSGKLIIVAILSCLIILTVLIIPPRVIDGDLPSLFSKRASEMEAASSSRLNQLKPLSLAIIKHPIIGSGFGTTVTYFTDDPRIVPATAGQTGEFTTYAFEWGYLDMLLKFGLVGLGVYLYLVYKILRKLLISNFQFPISKQISNFKLQILNPDYQLRFGFFLALIALLVVNIFSPYLNHPLGIGFIILSALMVTNFKTNYYELQMDTNKTDS